MPTILPPRLRATLASLLLALPFSANPAAADLDRRDVVRILGGLAAVYVLSEALERDREREEARARLPQATRPAPQPAQRGETYSHIHADGSGGGGWHDHTVGQNHATVPHPAAPVRRDPPQVARQAPTPAPLPTPRQSVDMRIIPTQCRTQAGNAIELADGYDAACMQNAVVLPGSLPPQCLRRVPTADGTRAVYEGDCLRREGWSTRIARN